MDYEILNWTSAQELKKEKHAEFFSFIDFNFATVFLLNDSSYLVMPLNPFGKSLYLKNKSILDSCINAKFFPVEEEINKFYFTNKEQIDNLNKYKAKLKSDLLNYIFKDKQKNKITLASEIDEIYDSLKKKRTFKKYELNFIVLAGDFVIEQSLEEFQWGILELKQLLTPPKQLILIINKETEYYFSIENSIRGKWGYHGMNSILQHSNTNKWEPDEFVRIIKIV